MTLSYWTFRRAGLRGSSTAGLAAADFSPFAAGAPFSALAPFSPFSGLPPLSAFSPLAPFAGFSAGALPGATDFSAEAFSGFADFLRLVGLRRLIALLALGLLVVLSH